MLASKNAAEPGGLSGKPLFALALDTIGRPRKRIGDGAALVYEGPARVRRLTA